ncbi:unnamed protein product, partial [Laminaria digitata]
NSGNGAQRAQARGIALGQREEDRGLSLKQRLLRIGSRGITQYLIEFSMASPPPASGGGGSGAEPVPAQAAAQVSQQQVLALLHQVSQQIQGHGQQIQEQGARLVTI